MKVKSIVRVLAAVAAASAFAPSSFAQAMLTNAPVTVSVSLTSQCKWAAAAPTLAVDFGTYTAFVGLDAAVTPQTFDLQCTRNFGLAPTVTWDDTVDGDADGKGVIAGLQYQLTLTGASTSAGNAATPTTAGTARVVTFSLGGTMPTLQPGDAAAAASHTRTVTMSF